MLLAQHRYVSPLAAVALSVICLSQASAAEIAFNIPPEPLPVALQAFGLQSGAPIVFDPSSVREIMSPGVTGPFEPDAALARLLVGTPFKHIRTGGGFTVIRSEALQSAGGGLDEVAGPAPTRPA